MRQTQDPIITRIPDILADAQKLLTERGQSYGGQQVNDYMPFGVQSYVQMVHLKTTRLVSGAKLGLEAHKLVDSALDLVNYAVFLVAYLDQQIQAEVESKNEGEDRG